jgi:hypothetical protein
MNKTTIYPGRAIAGAALIAAAWRYSAKNHNILGFLCVTFGSAFLGKSVIVNG